MRDGDVDYSRYTLRELEEALAGIDPHRFPNNHAHLCAAYERLKATPPAAAALPGAPRMSAGTAATAQGRQQESEREKVVRRGVYSLVMGAGAVFVYFNAIHGWVPPTEYHRVKGALLAPFMPVLKPYLSQIVIVLGIGLLGHAAYCLWRYRTLAKSGG